MDVQSAYLGSPSQDALIRAIGQMSLSQDHRAPKSLSTKQAMMIQCDPKVAELRRRCNNLRQEIKPKHGKIKSVEGTEIHRRYQLLRRELRAEIQYQRKERFREEREQFFNTIDSREIQQQFPGLPSSNIGEEHADTDIV